MIRWLATWVAVVGVGTSVWGGPMPPPVQNGSGFPLGQLFSRPAQTPHPAVVRVVVQERTGLSLGSGALVGVQGAYGLVVTNWHVVRDAAGPITVIFPDGFRSGATILKMDPEWDLAALAIWRPQVDPIPLAPEMPQLGEPLTIVGYGSGQYRAATGRCLQYLSPARHEPPEMIELSVAARQGDSGGPILNSQGQLAGVLFGASWGRTAGSSCRRVRSFLASLSPWFPLEGADTALAASAAPSAPPAAPSAPPPAMVSNWPSNQPSPAHLAGGSSIPVGNSSEVGGWLPAAGSSPPGTAQQADKPLIPPWPIPNESPRLSPHRSNPSEASSLPSTSGPNSLPPAAIPWPGSQPTRSPQVWAGSRQSSASGATTTLPPWNPSAKSNGGWTAPWPNTPPPSALPSASVSPGPEASSSQTSSRFEAIKNFLAFVGAVALLLLAVRVVSAASSE